VLWRQALWCAGAVVAGVLGWISQAFRILADTAASTGKKDDQQSLGETHMLLKETN
jgi:hypothetical protein